MGWDTSVQTWSSSAVWDSLKCPGDLQLLHQKTQVSCVVPVGMSKVSKASPFTRLCPADMGHLCWRSLNGKTWVALRVSVFCCIPTWEHHSWPVQWLQSQLLSLCFLSRLILLSGAETHSWKASSNWGLWAKIWQSTHVLTQVKTPSS